MNELALAILVTAGVTYALRAIPLVVVRGPIESVRVRSFLHYTPYAVLTALTIPAVFFATPSALSAVIGLALAVALAVRGLGLIEVALAAAGAVWLVEVLLEAWG